MGDLSRRCASNIEGDTVDARAMSGGEQVRTWRSPTSSSVLSGLFVANGGLLMGQGKVSLR
jgi:hypothetical protein